jgi:D-sedoheptulose 7-phosphate isomerase
MKLAGTLTSTVVEDHIKDVRRALEKIASQDVKRIVEVLLEAADGGGHIYIMGNGGSAATATHFACDLSKATVIDGRSRMRVTSLSDNVALLTAWANDTSYDRVFAEPIENLVEQGDVVIAISASGNSPNVVNGVRAARNKGALCIGLVGFEGGAVRKLSDFAVHVPSEDYGVVEDCHLVLEHAITAAITSCLMGEGRPEAQGEYRSNGREAREDVALMADGSC